MKTVKQINEILDLIIKLPKALLVIGAVMAATLAFLGEYKLLLPIATGLVFGILIYVATKIIVDLVAVYLRNNCDEWRAQNKKPPLKYDTFCYWHYWLEQRPLCTRCYGQMTWYYDSSKDYLTSAYESVDKKQSYLNCDNNCHILHPVRIYDNWGNLLDSESVKNDPLLNPNKS